MKEQVNGTEHENDIDPFVLEISPFAVPVQYSEFNDIDRKKKERHITKSKYQDNSDPKWFNLQFHCGTVASTEFSIDFRRLKREMAGGSLYLGGTFVSGLLFRKRARNF